MVRHLDEAVDEVRRSLVRKLSGPTKALVKGTRLILRKNPWNLTPKQRRALQALVRSSPQRTQAGHEARPPNSPCERFLRQATGAFKLHPRHDVAALEALILKRVRPS